MRRWDSQGSGSLSALLARRAAHTLKSGAWDMSSLQNPDLTKLVAGRTDRFKTVNRPKTSRKTQSTAGPGWGIDGLPTVQAATAGASATRKKSDERNASSSNEKARHDRPGGSKKTFGYVQRSDLTRDHSLVCAHLHTRRVLQAPSGLARSMTLGSPLRGSQER